MLQVDPIQVRVAQISAFFHDTGRVRKGLRQPCRRCLLPATLSTYIGVSGF
jgi:hypothetical protein